MSERQIVAFTDGASKGNPGPGGWGVIIVWPDGRVTELGRSAPSSGGGTSKGAAYSYLSVVDGKRRGVSANSA